MIVLLCHLLMIFNNYYDDSDRMPEFGSEYLQKVMKITNRMLNLRDKPENNIQYHIMNDVKVMNSAADNIRILAASMVEKANSGHPGGAMGGADFINVLYSEYLQYDPDNP